MRTEKPGNRQRLLKMALNQQDVLNAARRWSETKTAMEAANRMPDNPDRLKLSAAHWGAERNLSEAVEKSDGSASPLDQAEAIVDHHVE